MANPSERRAEGSPQKLCILGKMKIWLVFVDPRDAVGDGADYFVGDRALKVSYKLLIAHHYIGGVIFMMGLN